MTVRDTRVGRGTWQRASAARLVKLLLITPGHCMSRELAAEALWPGADPETSRTNLRKGLYFARRALSVPGAITSDGDLIRLDCSLIELDLDRLQNALGVLAHRTALRRALDGSGVSAAADRAESDVAQALAIALDLGGRTLLPEDVYEEWLVALREQLRSRWQEVAIEAARDAAASERRGEAHAILERILEHDPTDEEAHRLAIDLYATEGRYHAVRRQFERCRRALADGLDASPSAETEAAYRRAEHAARGQRTLSASARLVGRRRELGLVEPVLDRVATGRCAAIVLRGPAGIGKTRLLEAVRDYARSSGWRELAWQAVESTRSISFAPFAVRLAAEVTAVELEAWDEPARSALAMLVPSLGVAPHLTFADRSALQVALIAALARVTRRAPRLIAIDDLVSLDEASMELLGLAMTVLSGQPVLVAVTYRDEEPVPTRAHDLLDIFRRSGAVEVRLGSLPERDIEPLLVAHLGGEAVAAALAGELYARSEGNPLFCLELAREASDRGAITLAQGCWSLVPGGALGDAPETVRHVVAARSAALPPAAAELLHVAAELGQAEFGYEVLSAVLPESGGDLIAALDAALASGLLVERGAGYAFGHPLYRLALESSTGTARRAETQLAIARALAGVDQAAAGSPSVITSAAAQSADPTPVAEHALRACELGRTEAATLAVGFGFIAAARARVLLDRPAATALFERSLAVWRRLPASVAKQFNASDPYASLAELRMAEGDDTAAESAFRSAVAAARDADELAVAYERFTWLPYQHGDFQAATALAEEGLARLPADASAERAIIRQQLGAFEARLDRLQAAIAAYEDAIPALEAAGKLAYLSTALNWLGSCMSLMGRTEEGLALLQRALAIALDLRDARMEVFHRTHLGLLLTRAGRPAEARPHFDRSFELAEQMGDWYLESVCAWLAAEMEEALGNMEAARQMRLREIALLARIGGNPHNEAFAHAHLAHLARLLRDPETELREAERARELAASDPEPGYAARIERALSVASWNEIQTH